MFFQRIHIQGRYSPNRSRWPFVQAAQSDEKANKEERWIYDLMRKKNP